MSKPPPAPPSTISAASTPPSTTSSQALEKKSAGAIDAVGEQVALVAERLQKRHDDSVQRLSDRIAETAASARPLDGAEVDRLADRLDERVKESERRSAEAIGQIGEQVARVADRLQITTHRSAARSFEHRLDDRAARTTRTSSRDVLSDVQRRMEEVGEQSAASPGADAQDRLLAGPPPRSRSRTCAGAASPPPAKSRATSPSSTTNTLFSTMTIRPQTSSKAGSLPPPWPLSKPADAHSETADIVGVEPPPFDRKPDSREAHLVRRRARRLRSPPCSLSGEAARDIEDLLETDDVLLGPPPAAGEFVADLPPDDSREKLSAGYLDEARRAARQGRRVAPVTAKKGMGKGPLIASGMLAVAVAGGAALTVMRGKQEAPARRLRQARSVRA